MASKYVVWHGWRRWLHVGHLGTGCLTHQEEQLELDGLMDMTGHGYNCEQSILQRSIRRKTNTSWIIGHPLKLHLVPKPPFTVSVQRKTRIIH